MMRDSKSIQESRSRDVFPTLPRLHEITVKMTFADQTAIGRDGAVSANLAHDTEEKGLEMEFLNAALSLAALAPSCALLESTMASIPGERALYAPISKSEASGTTCDWLARIVREVGSKTMTNFGCSPTKRGV